MVGRYPLYRHKMLLHTRKGRFGIIENHEKVKGDSIAKRSKTFKRNH